MKDFKDKVAVITGAASGIGYGLAERAAKEGMMVVLADVEEEALVKAEKDIRAIGAATLTVKTDVSKAEDVKALADKTIDTFGAVHLLCNNAGVGPWTPITETTLADWQWVLGVNLWGVIYGIHFFLPIMQMQDIECHIVNTASSAAFIAGSYNAMYSCSKHGILALSESIYRELDEKHSHIGVSVLCPGVIKTRIQEPERNRPEALHNEQAVEKRKMADSELQSITQRITNAIATGMPPQQVAGIVFGSIREKKFYILPNIEPFIPRIRTRVEDILKERNPTNYTH